MRRKDLLALVGGIIGASALFNFFLFAHPLSGESSNGASISLPRSFKEEASIPDLHQGGVVLFYHVPKTGGTSVRALFQKIGKVVRIFSLKQFRARLEKDINPVLTNQQPQVLLLVELHGNLPGLDAWTSIIDKLRQTSRAHSVPFVTMTLLREPVSFHVSYFTSFHAPKCRFRWCEQQTFDLTEDNLLKSLAPNKQCEIFFHGQAEIKRGPRPVSTAECGQVRDALERDWDIVGSTSDLDTILYLLAEKAGKRAPVEAQNQRRKRLEVSDETKSKIRLISSLDQGLLQRFQ